DDIIRNALCHARLKRAAHGRLHRKAGGVFNYMLDADEIESGKSRVRPDLHEDVKIAVGPCVAAGTRSKDRKLRHALGFQGRSGGANGSDDFITGHSATIAQLAAAITAPSRRGGMCLLLRGLLRMPQPPVERGQERL